MKEAKDANSLSQESKVTHVKLQLNLCPSKSTTPVLKRSLVFAMFCARLFICALWSPAGKGLTSWLSFVVSSVSLSLSHWYPGSGVVLDCIDS